MRERFLRDIERAHQLSQHGIIDFPAVAQFGEGVSLGIQYLELRLDPGAFRLGVAIGVRAPVLVTAAQQRDLTVPEIAPFLDFVQFLERRAGHSD